MTDVTTAFPDDLIPQMIEAGVHYGHRVARWNPKMRDFIYGKRNFIHIIDLRQTLKGLIRACHFLEGVGNRGLSVLMVGTKRQAKAVVQEVSHEHGINYVTERWLGGTLTNHRTIRMRLKRLEELEELEESGKMAAYSKKHQVRLLRERDKIFRNLNGVRSMEKLPGAVVVVDANREHIALREADKLRIPTLAVIDTDSDPDPVDICIPANDDSVQSVRMLVGLLGEAYARGKVKHDSMMAERAKAQPTERATPQGTRPAPVPRKPAGGGRIKRFSAENLAQKGGDGFSTEPNPGAETS